MVQELNQIFSGLKEDILKLGNEMDREVIYNDFY
jgi:hypothetical protein